MVIINSFFTGALYNCSKLKDGYLNKRDKVCECCSCLKLMIQAYLHVVFLIFFIKHVSLNNSITI